MVKYVPRCWVIGLILLIASCQNEPQVEEIEATSSFDLIQSEILKPSCVACHMSGTSFARQSDLVLTKDVAYAQLVNRLPSNEAAKDDGLELVGTKGLESLYNSFLWEKINSPDFEHFYTDHAEYGELMPIGGPSLTNGELEYIRQWIVAGAPEEGFPVEADVLKDTSRFEFPDQEFARLDLPESGFQLNIGPFDIAPDFEREFYYYEPLNNSEEIFIDRVEILMREGSHHFILYDFPLLDFPQNQVYRDLRVPNGPDIDLLTVATIQNQRFVFGTQWRSIDYQFPEGVALRIPANWGFDLNSHYVNRTAETKIGEVSINIHTVDPGEVVYKAENLFLQNQDILLPPNKETTLEKTWSFNETRHVFQLYSHAHETMTEFRMEIVGGVRDGELVYFTRDWEHPPVLDLDPPITLFPGEGLKAITTYNNQSNQTLTWGLFSVNEMMMILGAYYKD